VFVADVLGAIFAYGAIQTALVQRGRTGTGQQVDVALMDCMINMLVYELQEAQFAVSTARPTYGPVRASDGDLIVAPITARNFAALCDVTDSAVLRSDPRFASLPARNAHWQQMMAIVEDWTRQRSVAECVAALDAAGVPCSAYGDPADALTDPHLQQRGLFSRVRDAGGEFVGVNPPQRMSGARAELRERVAGIGADADGVLAQWLSMPRDVLDGLRARGALGVQSP
jgi:crotonobetainyl-CoA:carnitine CoA-transferase CaiB-like acyl-CoA transferase